MNLAPNALFDSMMLIMNLPEHLRVRRFLSSAATLVLAAVCAPFAAVPAEGDTVINSDYIATADTIGNVVNKYDDQSDIFTMRERKIVLQNVSGDLTNEMYLRIASVGNIGGNLNNGYYAYIGEVGNVSGDAIATGRINKIGDIGGNLVLGSHWDYGYQDIPQSLPVIGNVGGNVTNDYGTSIGKIGKIGGDLNNLSSAFFSEVGNVSGNFTNHGTVGKIGVIGGDVINNGNTGTIAFISGKYVGGYAGTAILGNVLGNKVAACNPVVHNEFELTLTGGVHGDVESVGAHSILRIKSGAFINGKLDMITPAATIPSATVYLNGKVSDNVLNGGGTLIVAKETSVAENPEIGGVLTAENYSLTVLGDHTKLGGLVAQNGSTLILNGETTINGNAIFDGVTIEFSRSNLTEYYLGYSATGIGSLEINGSANFGSKNKILVTQWIDGTFDLMTAANGILLQAWTLEGIASGSRQTAELRLVNDGKTLQLYTEAEHSLRLTWSGNGSQIINWDSNSVWRKEDGSSVSFVRGDTAIFADNNDGKENVVKTNYYPKIVSGMEISGGNYVFQGAEIQSSHDVAVGNRITATGRLDISGNGTKAKFENKVYFENGVRVGEKASAAFAGIHGNLENSGTVLADRISGDVVNKGTLMLAILTKPNADGSNNNGDYYYSPGSIFSSAANYNGSSSASTGPLWGENGMFETSGSLHLNSGTSFVKQDIEVWVTNVSGGVTTLNLTNSGSISGASTWLSSGTVLTANSVNNRDNMPTLGNIVGFFLYEGETFTLSDGTVLNGPTLVNLDDYGLTASDIFQNRNLTLSANSSTLKLVSSNFTSTAESTPEDDSPATLAAPAPTALQAASLATPRTQVAALRTEADLNEILGNVRNEGALFTIAITGNVENSGTLRVPILTGDLFNHPGGLARLNEVTGNITNRGTLHLDTSNSRWQGTLDNGGGYIDFVNAGRTLTVDTLTATSGVSTIRMDINLRNPAASDKFVVLGQITGTHLFLINAIGGTPSALTRTDIAHIPFLVAENDIPGDETITGKIQVGAYQFDFVPAYDASGASYYLGGDIHLSATSQAAIATMGAMAPAWFSQTDSLHKRFGELRLGRAGTPPAPANESTTCAPSPAFWLRAYGQQANTDLDIVGVSRFRDYQYGGDVGLDHAFAPASNALLYLGGFIGYQSAHRSFRIANSGDGDTEALNLGIYATLLHASGLYVGGVLKGQFAESDYDALGDHGEFDHYGFGASIEVGRRVELPKRFFIEPSVQFTYAHVFTETHSTTHGLRVKNGDADLFRYSATLRAGKVFDLGSAGLLQPYAKIGGEYQDSLGGDIRIASDMKLRPNTDGVLGVAGAGLTWVFDGIQSVYLDYEASYGEKYTVPWSVNFGYRLRF